MVAGGPFQDGSLWVSFPFPLISALLYALLSAEVTAEAVFMSNSLL